MPSSSRSDERVVGRALERGVAGDGRDAEQLGVAGGDDDGDGVVVAGVAVEDASAIVPVHSAAESCTVRVRRCRVAGPRSPTGRSCCSRQRRRSATTTVDAPEHERRQRCRRHVSTVAARRPPIGSDAIATVPAVTDRRPASDPASPTTTRVRGLEPVRIVQVVDVAATARAGDPIDAARTRGRSPHAWTGRGRRVDRRRASRPSARRRASSPSPSGTVDVAELLGRPRCRQLLGSADETVRPSSTLPTCVRRTPPRTRASPARRRRRRRDRTRRGPPCARGRTRTGVGGRP